MSTSNDYANLLGTLNRHADFPSRFVEPRHVDVWLPPAHAVGRPRGFPVIYMHDGQNLFDPETAYIGVDWGIDEAIVRLANAGKISEPIVVGIWNTVKRTQEYLPQKPWGTDRESLTQDHFTEVYGGDPQSDSYLRFLVEEVKPFVDRTYRTLPARETTFVMGSSMGGLVSIYALCEYPHVFRGAGCLSTHWPAAQKPVIEYLSSAIPRPGAHKIYFDHGTETLDASYEDYQRQVDDIIKEIGYIDGKDWMTRKFVGAEHSEKAWRERIHIPLEFLLG